MLSRLSLVFFPHAQHVKWSRRGGRSQAEMFAKFLEMWGMVSMVREYFLVPLNTCLVNLRVCLESRA
jgi:hypothetical protein